MNKIHCNKLSRYSVENKQKYRVGSLIQMDLLTFRRPLGDTHSEDGKYIYTSSIGREGSPEWQNK